MNDCYGELFENAFRTGDYSKLKEMIETYERESVFLYPNEKKVIEILNYFINLNKKIDLEFFSAKDEFRFKKAIRSGNFKKITSYLKKYEDFQVFEWVKEGLVEKVAQALQTGLNPNKKTGDNESLLEVASAFGQTEIVAMLIKKGAKINPSFFDRAKESSALRKAVYHNHTETALLLLDHGAKIMDNFGSSEILSIAVQNKNEILVKRILTVAQEKIKNDALGKEMFWAWNSSLSDSIVRQDEKMVKLLLDAGATFQPNEYRDPLKEALLTHNKNIIDMVYEKASKEERAIMASISIQNRCPFAMFHLYQKKCPVFSDDLDKFTIEKIIGHTFTKGDRKTFDYIMQTLSEDEKAKIDWEKTKEDLSCFPIDAQKFIKKSFPEVFQEVVSSKPQQTQEQVVRFQTMQCCSVSGNSCDEDPIVVDAFSRQKTNTTLVCSYQLVFPQKSVERGDRAE